MVSVLEIGIALMTFTHKIFTGVSMKMSFQHATNLAWSGPSPLAAALSRGHTCLAQRSPGCLLMRGRKTFETVFDGRGLIVGTLCNLPSNAARTRSGREHSHDKHAPYPMAWARNVLGQAHAL